MCSPNRHCPSQFIDDDLDEMNFGLDRRRPSLFNFDNLRRMTTEKQAIAALENVGTESKVHLGEQLKTIDNHVSQHISVCSDLADFLKKKAELDLEYSRKLEKLTDQHLGKLIGTKGQKSLNGYQQCFWHLLTLNKQTCADTANDSNLTTDYVVPHIIRVISILKHVYEQLRSPLIKTQDEFLILAGQLTGYLKNYQASHGAFRYENSKYETAVGEYEKIRSQQDPKGKNANKLKAAEKRKAKCQSKRDDALQKLNVHRNDYLLAIQAMNYFLNDIYNSSAPQFVEAMFFGHFEWSAKIFKSIYQLQEETIKRKGEKIKDLKHAVSALNDDRECSQFIESNTSVFTPKEALKFQFAPHSTKGDSDQVNVLCLDPSLKNHYDNIKVKYTETKQKIHEIDKDIEKCKEDILETVGRLSLDYSCILDSFTPSKAKSSLSLFCQTFNDSLEKLREQQSSLIASYTNERRQLTNGGIRLKGRKDLIESMFGENIELNVGSYNTVCRNRIRRRGQQSRRAVPLRPSFKVNVPLFGGRIDSYCSAAQVDIPPVVTSCINRIATTEGGLTHPGIFRHNGSQLDINNLKSLFEKNEDPLDDDTNQNWNWHTIAGLLKLYFRELEEPLFPNSRFEELIGTLAKRGNSETDFLTSLTDFVTSMNVNVLITMRYLFDFLNRLSQYSDKNMMDDYNLAVCWGPTLFPIPDDKDQVVHHNGTIDIIQTFINHSYSIFPRNYGLLFDENEGMGSTSEDGGDLDETDNELDEDDPDSLRLDNVSTYSLTSHNAPDLVLDLPPASANAADSSESAEDLCATLPSTAPSSAAVVTEGDTPEAPRPRAISLNIDLDGATVGGGSGSSPMLAERKANLAKLGGIPAAFYADPRNPKPKPRLNSPSSGQAAAGSTDSNESLNQSSGAATASVTGGTAPQSAPVGGTSSASVAPPTFPKPAAAAAAAGGNVKK